MIIIFSEETDNSTSKVIDWINYYERQYLRIDDLSLLNIIKYDINNNKFEFEYNNISVTSDIITGYWYRRGLLTSVQKEISNNKEINNVLNNLINTEEVIAKEFLFLMIEKLKIKKIGSYFKADFNKLSQLNLAMECDIQIPKSILSRDISNYKNNYITKSLDTVFVRLKKNNTFLMNYTNIITDKLSDNYFGLSYLQEKIDKKFEIRTFYLEGKTFSMGIFSQSNNKTKVDFRHYDDLTPNRNIPLKLPKELDEKIIKFMKKLKLNTGSLDFIYTKNEEYIFLEVNPIGQFGMTSLPCNYNLEKEIAKYLIEDEK
jgi:ATP-GRASP peptide maturase of grasp-with-spasm system